MESLSAILTIVAVVLVYRHTSGKATYNRVLVLLLCLLSLVPCLIAAALGWHNNPRRAAGDSWRTAI